MGTAVSFLIILAIIYSIVIPKAKKHKQNTTKWFIIAFATFLAVFTFSLLGLPHLTPLFKSHGLFGMLPQTYKENKEWFFNASKLIGIISILIVSVCIQPNKPIEKSSITTDE